MKKDLIIKFYINLLRITTLVTGIAYLFDSNITVIISALIFCMLTFIPKYLDHFFKIKVPRLLLHTYIFFLSVLFLGWAINFYQLLFWWDIIIHFTSGIFFFQIGMFITKDTKINKKERLFFVLLLVGGSSLTWEILEFFSDSIFKTNSQEWQHMMYEPYIPLVKQRGHALVDTMTDMIYGLVGYIFSLCIYYLKFFYYVYKA